MIYILCGEDIDASYQRLGNLLEKFPSSQKISFSSKHTLEDLSGAILTIDIFSKPKIIVCEDYLKGKKVKPVFLGKVPKDTNLIFWERAKLSTSEIARFQKLATIENFNLPPTIFRFLDSISPTQKKTLKALAPLKADDKNLLVWHLAQRLLLLILAKLGLNLQEARSITKRTIYDWQWAKISNQSQQFEIDTLHVLYSGLLKIDQMEKTGVTSQDAKVLISLLFIKYLK